MAQTRAAKLCYVRGDTAPKSFLLKQDGAPVDLTAVTGILITVTVERTRAAPLPTPTVIAQFLGFTSGGGADGRINFQPQGANQGERETVSNLFVPGKYNYSVRYKNVNGEEITPIAQGKFDMLEAKATS